MSLRSIERNNIRWSRYKVAMDVNESRQRREDNMIKIRKNRREKNLLTERGDNGGDSGDDGDGDSESSNQQFNIKDAICYTTVLNVHSNKSDKEVCNGLRKIKTIQEPPLHNRSSIVELKQKVIQQRYKLIVGIDEGRRKKSNQMVENWKTMSEDNLLKKHHEVHLQSFTIGKQINNSPKVNHGCIENSTPEDIKVVASIQNSSCKITLKDGSFTSSNQIHLVKSRIYGDIDMSERQIADAVLSGGFPFDLGIKWRSSTQWK